MKFNFFPILCLAFLFSCSKSNEDSHQYTQVPTFSLSATQINGINNSSVYYTTFLPLIKLSFSDKIDKTSAANFIALADSSGGNISLNYSYSNGDSVVIVQPPKKLKPLSKYTLTITSDLQSQSGRHLQPSATINLITQIDSTPKFATISDSALLDLVQKQTFKYFWDFGHPVSGMARERNNGDNETIALGGTGFGIMATVVAVNRGFVTRSKAVARLNTIVNFLITKCERWHGAFAHWINGTTGETIPFYGTNDGADIVETSYLLEGLLAARQYFNSTTDAGETTLRDSVNSIWNAVDWNWFTQNGAANSLYWQYNPSYTSVSDIWSIPVTGWNEALITYVLAASSKTHAIGKSIYDNGWAQNGAMKNGSQYYGYQLPLGPELGGPLFFEHYSFMGLNPTNLKDVYADYFVQTKNHSLINHAYCKANPGKYFGYSDTCWGMTASDADVSSGYNVNSPTNDIGVISPTAAISSLPYTPKESMNALRFFYYQLGDKLWKDYGFVDAFSLKDLWFANSFVAIDQGPEIVMIENYRSGLLWNLFMSCPEVKSGLQKLGFTF